MSGELLPTLAYRSSSSRSRFVFRSTDDELNGNVHYPYNYAEHPHRLAAAQQLLHDLLSFEMRGGRIGPDGFGSDRFRKNIDRGDPREFMG